MESEELYSAYLKALSIVTKASSIVLEGFNKRKKVTVKEAAYDLVTEYDREVEEFIKSELSKEFPQHGFLGEETSKRQTVSDGLSWVLDPIDGTNNFVHSCPESAISLALTSDKEPIIGIVSCPMLQRFYSAAKGYGAFLNGAPIHTSSTASIGESLVAIEMSLGAKSKQLLNRLAKRNSISVSSSHGVRCCGSAVLGLCNVAQGVWDVYHTEGLFPWDVAAGVLIVTEAGGKVTDSLGDKFDIDSGRVLAANSESLVKNIADLFRSVE